MSWDSIELLVHVVIALLAITISLLAAGHAVLNKRDPRAAVGWILLCLTVPILGPVIYLSIGVNRVRRRALEWKAEGRRLTATGAFGAASQPALERGLEPTHLAELRQVGDSLIHRPLVGGTHVEPLVDGEQAYPAMLAAIDGAKSSVHLSTYIFDTDGAGQRFADALIAAAKRGVKTRLLIDALGERYSWPRAPRLFRGSQVEVARFLPVRNLAFNLRNHRKILVVDGTTGFTGGMNIGDRHLLHTPSRKGPVADLQFRVAGPVVSDLQRIFLEDWFFATREKHEDPALFPAIAPAGEAAARAIDDGPDDRNRKLHWLIMGALATASRSVRIMTPYFIPDRGLLAALVTTALRGVKVTIVLPGTNNLPYVDWASRAWLGELLYFGADIRRQPPPFVHSKLLLVDDVWSLVGSANLDPRSLRLNFELGLEVWDPEFGRRLAAHFDAAAARSTPVTLEGLDARPLWQKLRDGSAKLLSPYL